MSRILEDNTDFVENLSSAEIERIRQELDESYNQAMRGEVLDGPSVMAEIKTKYNL